MRKSSAGIEAKRSSTSSLSLSLQAPPKTRQIKLKKKKEPLFFYLSTKLEWVAQAPGVEAKAYHIDRSEGGGGRRWGPRDGGWEVANREIGVRPALRSVAGSRCALEFASTGLDERTHSLPSVSM